MSLFDDRTYDYTKEHKELDHTPLRGVYCTHCLKTLDKRETLESLSMMMLGSVWAKQSLPCKPYEKPSVKDKFEARSNEVGATNGNLEDEGKK